MTKITFTIPGYKYPIILSSESNFIPKSLDKSAIELDPSTTKYIEGLESIRNDIMNITKSINTYSMESGNFGENAKKILAWIIEKIKALIKFITDFFEKVKMYLRHQKHQHALSEKDAAISKLKMLINKQPDIAIVDLIISDKYVLSAYMSAKQWNSLPSESFRQPYENFIRETKLFISRFRLDNANEYNDNYSQFVTRIDKTLNDIKTKNKEFLDKMKTESKNREMAVDILKYYDSILSASQSVQTYLEGLRLLTIAINRIIGQIHDSEIKKITSQIHDFEIREEATQHVDDNIRILQYFLVAISNITNGLLSLYITQSIPLLDTLINRL
jgi:hypothetical protein